MTDGKLIKQGLEEFPGQEQQPVSGWKELETKLRSLMTGEFSSLTLSFNDSQAPNYNTFAQWVDELGENAYPEKRMFVSPEEWQRAIDQNSVWGLHWYPLTPNGFTAIFAGSLSALMESVFPSSQTEAPGSGSGDAQRLKITAELGPDGEVKEL